MCGIAGVLNLDGSPVSPLALKRMADAIAHRGPDGEGFYSQDSLGLAHRRLAILDLSSAGHQPMATADGRFVLSYNGEIYNFRELRRELEALGHQFHSQTDTEVLLEAWAQWGEAALTRLNGMFAFALWDKKRAELYLVRDRYGVKPLYYRRGPNALLFGSEVKAILAAENGSPRIDRQALLEYFTFQNFFTDRTLFENVHLLPPGTYIKVTLDGNIASRRYWDFHFHEPERPLREGEYREQLSFLIRQAVRRQLVSDVPVGAYLSGGMDSGSITALAGQNLPYLKTFTCGFDLRSASGMELYFDEREKAEYMSYLFKTEHYEMVLKAGDMERILPRMATHLEEPRMGQSYPNFYIAQLAGKFVKVILSGAGGDELFGGYPWRYYRAAVNNNFEDYIDKYYLYWQRLIPNRAIKDIFVPIWNDVSQVWTRDIFRDVFQQHARNLMTPEDYINHSLYFEAKTFLHGLLIVEDKLSMAHSLETRVPFLDNDLVDFAMSVPVRYKLANLGEVIRLNENEPTNKSKAYFQRTHDGKLILREAMKDIVPQEIVEAKKQGFSAPDASWFKGDSIEYVRRVLWNKHARLYEYLDRNSVQALVAEHLDGQENRRLLVWSLLNFEQFLENFVSN